MSADSPATSPTSSARARGAWRAVEWGLVAAWMLDAALVMSHRQAGFFTSHAADLTLPAWLYVALRRTRHATTGWRRSLATLAPVPLASVLFLASAATEISQHFWPRGPFPGTFDPLDVLAYAIGIGLCCIADLRWPVPARGPAPPAGNAGGPA